MAYQSYYNPDRSGGYQPKAQKGTKIIKMNPPNQGSSVMPPKPSQNITSVDCDESREKQEIVYCVIGITGYNCKELESVWATYELANAHIKELRQREIMFYVQACPVRGV